MFSKSCSRTSGKKKKKNLTRKGRLGDLLSVDKLYNKKCQQTAETQGFYKKKKKKTSVNDFLKSFQLTKCKLFQFTWHFLTGIQGESSKARRGRRVSPQNQKNFFILLKENQAYFWTIMSLTLRQFSWRASTFCNATKMTESHYWE